MFIQMFASHGRSDKTWVVVCALVSWACVCGGGWEVERGGEGFDPSVLAGHARTDMGGGKGVYQHRGSLSATGPSMKLTLFA